MKKRNEVQGGSAMPEERKLIQFSFASLGEGDGVTKGDAQKDSGRRNQQKDLLGRGEEKAA